MGRTFPSYGDGLRTTSTRYCVVPSPLSACSVTVLWMTRTGVAWFAVGCQMGAYEHALRYATERTQFGRPIGGFQLVQDLLVPMLGNVTSAQAMMLRLSQHQNEGVMRADHAALAK